MYMVGLLVAFLGLMAANQVQAGSGCLLACGSNIGYAVGSGVISR